MCGRYVLKAEKEAIEKEFDSIVEQAKQAEQLNHPRFNIAPSQIVLAVRQFEFERIANGLKWGLIPSWAKEESIGNRMINARAESITEKPSFRNAFRSRRCIVPASGFYEWKQTGGKGAKQPFYFHLKDKPVFGFAGLWETWKTEEGEEIESCTIITTEANAVLAPVHDRMPIIIKPEDYEAWLDPKNFDTDDLQKFLKPYPSYEMASHAVSRQVNSPSFDGEELINPVEINSL
ncbi:MAG TPA: SOS response-associated peptidase [Pyrinomonadaceae bacterium]|jgi:putative SOS response-associated peptidase YedK